MYATKIRSAGIWFSNYNNLAGSGLINTPHVYLIPVGVDTMRTPGSLLNTREWKIMDQIFPVPFPLNPAALSNGNWRPIADTVTNGEDFIDIRRYAMFRAYHDAGNFNALEVDRSGRLIGRSVWNSKWLLIIPGLELNSNRDEGIQTFINGPLSAGVRTGNGVSDIRIFFQNYSYPGN